MSFPKPISTTDYYNDVVSTVETSAFPTYPCSDMDLKHQQWSKYYGNSDFGYNAYFNADTIRTISRKITELTMGVDRLNRPIVVPNDKICNVMNAIYENYRPQTGSIYSRYTIPMGETTQSYVQDMIDQVIEIITSDIRVSLGMEEQNSQLSIWTTVLGDFNDKGLRAYAPIKTLKRRPNPMEINMRY
jgi:hypothetical protein